MYGVRLMKVLIVHYHLKPGGVTTVIRRQLRALSAKGIEAAVLSGEAPADSWEGESGKVQLEPALGYDIQPDMEAKGSISGRDSGRIHGMVNAMRRELASLGSDAIVHVHNPTIQKNSGLLTALSELASSGHRILMHVHDLAEDWRPDVYPACPYPEGARWAAINRFDVAALAEAGAGSAAYLPDPVPVPPLTQESDNMVACPKGPGLVLYPVRGIRRKNLGEAVLLSLFGRKGSSIGVTLPPVNPRDIPYYNAWQKTAAAISAPIRFGIGLERSFNALYSEAVGVVTTSIKEGFGMSYLEPASRGRVTLGRRLSRVVSDFEEAGLEFPALYDALMVPRGSFNEHGFASRVELVVQKTSQAFGMSSAGNGFGRLVVDSILGGIPSGPDFGRLDEIAQGEVLRSIAADRNMHDAFITLNPAIDGWDSLAQSIEPPARERMEEWSEAAYGERLSRVYQDLLEHGGGPAPDTRKLLQIYIRPEAFHGVGV
jgi:hypothetical protein